METNNVVVKCPNCGMKLHDNFCMHCGYMTNGVYVNQNKTKSISDVEMYLGERYDKINRNQNSFVPFFLGPLYLFYNKCILVGTLCMIFDVLFCLLALFLFDRRPVMAIFFSFLTLRIGYATVANAIYLWLCKIKVYFIKKIYKDKYVEVLRKGDKNTASLLFLILGLAVAATGFWLILDFIRK